MKQSTALICLVLAASCGNEPASKNNVSTNNDANNTNNVSTNNASNNATSNVTTTNNTNVATGCTLDADCAALEACEAQTCVATCSGDPDCTIGFECREGVNTSQNICQPIEPNNSNNTTNTNNTNSTNNTTNNGLADGYIVRVQSTTTGDDACGFVQDPGPDLFGVALEDDVGTVLGWANVVWENITLDGNDYTDVGILDGAPPNLADGFCPDMFDGNVVSLGCESPSFLLLEFLDANGNRIGFDANSGLSIRVYEWGAQCTTGSVLDTYNVDICTDTAAAVIGDDSSCSVQVVVDGSGEVVGSVPFF